MKIITTLLTSLFSVSSLTDACCMAPKTYKGTISQDMHEAIMMHAEGREELVLGIKYKLTPDKNSKSPATPDTFAWVITVPNEPDHYALADRALFEKTFAWGESLVVQKPRTKGAFGKKQLIVPEGIILSDEVKVGPYTIQPIKAKGLHAIKGLNTWLNKNGFPQEDEDHMKYFIEKDFTFLCVKINTKSEGTGVPNRGSVKPLHLSFASEQPYFPLKFSSRQGKFGINIWMLTKDKLNIKESAPLFSQLNMQKAVSNDRVGFNDNVEVKKTAFPKALQNFVDNCQTEQIKTNTQWNLSVIRASAVNDKVKIADWKSDLFFPIVKASS